ncbi:D-aminoacylase [Phytoactinopolyspora alkaliphila]|uniref:D-aminoacylase n=1 Tax=Phytoactinopolyspora alkaliphila TaxID=1783498 RepID=A0A6N9YJD2_9ACTN|nr:D-aminoacylase [Phytoactinopolyspora alkaliphila]
MPAELLIRGGLVHDGTGARPRRADVVVDDGVIVEVTSRAGHAEAARVIDAGGLAVSPGFIDVHTHSDVSVLLDGRAESKIHQGVTTEVTGNCGFSPFPLVGDVLEDQLDLLAGLGHDPVTPTWTDLDGYAVAVEAHGVAVNVAPLVGHGQLRIAALGMAEKASAGGIAAMRRLLADQLEQGAFGMSTGLTYVPSRYAGWAELSELCSVLAAHDALYATHARADVFPAVEEAASLGGATGARIQYSHVALNEPASWGNAGRLLEAFEAARRSGIDICCDVYPYDASASALTQYLPAWVQEGGVPAMRRRLADPVVSRRAEEELAGGWGPGGRIPWLWERVVIARGTPAEASVPAPDGATIEEAAAAAGMPPARYVLELCREGGNSVQVVLFYRTEEDVRTFLRCEFALMGSDGSAVPFDQRGARPHPRGFGAHARLLGRYTRELGDLDLSTAVRKMTGAVADRIGLPDRGVLAPGKAADIVVFDPATVTDRATFLDPCRPPSGIHHVVVNGEVVIDAGVQTGARPGKVLRSA